MRDQRADRRAAQAGDHVGEIMRNARYDILFFATLTAIQI